MMTVKVLDIAQYQIVVFPVAKIFVIKTNSLQIFFSENDPSPVDRDWETTI